MSKPFILGLTGSIGMGKSAVAAMFRGLGVPVFDADAAVHELQGPGGACIAAIERAFPSTTGPLGVDRQKLGAAVFGDPAALKRLEAIVHPEVAELRRTFLADNADAPLIVFDIPLLYEKSGQHGLDAVVVVSAPAEAQRVRVLARRGDDAREVCADPGPAGTRRRQARAGGLCDRYRYRARRNAWCGAATGPPTDRSAN